MDLAPVSVVIPAYNSEEFIGEAIRSVLAQTLPVSEIIVVDDGSSDSTAEVAAKLGADVIRQEHGGISMARNAGIRAARHEWIAFMDADDIWMRHKLEWQWQVILRHPDVGLVNSELIQFVEGSKNKPQIMASGNLLDLDADISYSSSARGDFLADGMTYNTPTIIVRRNLLLDVGLFDEGMLYAGNVDVCLRVIARCPVALIKRPLVIERLHSKNHSRSYTGMSLSWIRMIDRITAEPDKYPPGAANALGKDVFDQLLPVGRKLLDEGRMREARNLFARSLKSKFSRRGLVLWALSLVDSENFNRLLVIKRKLKLLTGQDAPMVPPPGR